MLAVSNDGSSSLNCSGCAMKQEEKRGQGKEEGCNLRRQISLILSSKLAFIAQRNLASSN